MDLDGALRWLDGHLNRERVAEPVARPTLDRIRALTTILGDPQHAYPVIHITGTNGKGSCARIVSQLLATSGLSVGTYTSPHLVRVHERISRNGEPIDDDSLADGLATVAALEPTLADRPSWFDVVVAVAYRWFADVAVDVAVIEVGLGGRFDSTNVADGRVALVTNIAKDHVEYLGSALSGIAREKAGIIKPDATLVLGETDPELVPIFLEEALLHAAWQRGDDFDVLRNALAVGGRALDLQTPGAIYDALYLPLHGEHQGLNASASLAAAEAFFGRPLDEEVVREALAAVDVPGRFEVVSRSPLVVLDGAHNPHGARTTVATLDDFSADRRVLVVGFQGRDPDEMLDAFAVGADDRVVVATRPPSPRATDPAAIAAAAVRRGASAVVVDDPARAVDHALSAAEPADAVVISGSLLLVGAAREHLGYR